VEQVVGTKEKTGASNQREEEQSSSSQSEDGSLLEVELEEERASTFTAILNGTAKIRMDGCMQIEDLQTELNDTMDSDGTKFSKLEVHTLLKRLEKRDKIMVTWDTGTIYTI